MKRVLVVRPFRWAILLSLLVLPSAAHAQRVTDQLAWLSGCWERRTPTSVTQEQWSSPAGGMLHGFSRIIRRDTVVEYEFVRIYAAGDTLVYDAQPARQPRTEFRAVAPFQPEIVFANPAHDFPQRIVYRSGGPDSLFARIEGLRGGQLRAVTYPYARVKCS